MFKNGQCLQLANGTNNCLTRITTHKKNGPDEKRVSHTERMQAEAKWTSAVGVLGIGSLGISKVPFHSDSMIPLPDSQVFPPATYFALCQGLCSCLTGFSRVMVFL